MTSVLNRISSADILERECVSSRKVMRPLYTRSRAPYMPLEFRIPGGSQ